MMTPSEIAAQPATASHIARARDAVRTNPSKQASLDALLASNPTCGQVVDFLGTMNQEVAAEQLKQRIAAICTCAGIENPTNAERLAAMQVGLLQDQNMMLQNGINRVLARLDANAKLQESDSAFTGLLGGMIIGSNLLGGSLNR